MSREVRLRPEAAKELLSAVEWLAENAPDSDAAQRFHDVWAAALRSLANFAEAHPIALEAREGEFSLRNAFVGLGRSKTHRIVYRGFDDIVVVLRLRSMRQRPLNRDEIDG